MFDWQLVQQLLFLGNLETVMITLNTAQCVQCFLWVVGFWAVEWFGGDLVLFMVVLGIFGQQWNFWHQVG